MARTAWKRYLATSKRAQGIATPVAPRRKVCGCWYRKETMFTSCYNHLIEEVFAKRRAKEEARLKAIKENLKDAFPISNATLVA